VTLTVWYHDPTEVDVKTSWTGLVPGLAKADYRDIRKCTDAGVTALFGYARPDAVVAGERPLLSIEQTKMNPSGHNLPQRFSCLLRASELGVPSVLYHPEYARRTYSDPNPRYTNPRVALAQLRMLDLFPDAPPSVSLYWPTDPSTLLPDLSQGAQANLAELMRVVLEHDGRPDLRATKLFAAQRQEMERVIEAYGPAIRANRSYREFFPDGLPHARTKSGHSVDPPRKAIFRPTGELVEEWERDFSLTDAGRDRARQLADRDISLTFKGTPNKARNDSEHPWPGYLTLLDVLYTRTGSAVTDRRMNLVYGIDLPMRLWISRVEQGKQPPAMTRIVDALADVIVLADGIVSGRSRGVPDAHRVLARR
jgi:hypothetical protein